MRRCIPFANIAVLATAILARGTTQAEILGVGEVNTAGGAPGGPYDSAQFRFGWDFPGDPIFDGMLYRPSDAGRTFTVTQVDDPDFTALTAALTNGKLNNVSHLIVIPGPGGAGTGLVAPEAIFFDLPAPQIDFAGFTIDSISLRLREFTTVFQEGFTNYTFRGNIIVEGRVVPEPATCALMAIGLTVVAAFRRRHA